MQWYSAESLLKLLGNISSNSTIRSKPVQQQLLAMEQLLRSQSISMLSFLNSTNSANASVSTRTMQFVSEYVKSSLLAVSLPPFLAVNRSNGTDLESFAAVQISIPTSANTLTVQIPYDLAGANGIGALVTMIELSSALVALTGKIRNNSDSGVQRGEDRLASIRTPVLASDVISISLVGVNGNLSVSRPVLPTFEASLTLSSVGESMEDVSRLNHNCSLGVVEVVPVLCRASGVWLNVSCSGKARAHVKTSCPVFRHMCIVLDLTDNSVASKDYCQTIRAGAGSVLCRCGFETAVTKNESKALAKLNGKISVAAVGSFASSGLDASASVVVRPLGDNVANESVLVFVSFGSLWVIGVVCFLGLYWDLNKVKGMQIDSSEACHNDELTKMYIMLTLPVSLHCDQRWVWKVWEMLCIKHKVISIIKRLMGYRSNDFVNESRERQQRRQLLDVVYVVTSLTMSFFIVALFYDLQSPVDDGYCGQWSEQAACEMTKTALDSHVNKCVWMDISVDVTAAIVAQSVVATGQMISTSVITADVTEGTSKDNACRLNTHTLSSRAFLLAFLITSVVSILGTFVLKMIFDILEALPSSYIRTDNCSVVPEVQSDAVGKIQEGNVYHRRSPGFHSVVPSALTAEDMSEREVLVRHSVARARTIWRESLRSSVMGVDEKDTSSLQNHSVQYLVAGVKMLQLLMLDLLKREGSMSRYELRLIQEVMLEWFPEKLVVSSVYWQYGMWMVLLLMHAGALYFLLAKAAVRGYEWQVAFFSGAMSEVLWDILFIQVMEVLLLDYGLVVVLLASRIEATRHVLLSCILTPSSGKHSIAWYREVPSAAMLRGMQVSLELSDMLKNYAYLPEAAIVSKVIEGYMNRVGQIEESKYHKEESILCCKQVLFWWLSWLPKEMVQALVTLTAASSATFVLYVYFFVLLPVISENLAWLVLVAPVSGVVCWLILRDVLSRRDKVVTMGADDEYGNMNNDSHIVEVAEDEMLNNRDGGPHHDMETDDDVEDANSTNSWQWSRMDEEVSDKDMRSIGSELVGDRDMSLCGDVASDTLADMFSEPDSLSGDVSDADYSDVHF
jgi:hypothetical protein